MDGKGRPKDNKMKKSRAETAETRKKIIDAASRLFRRDGIHATGLAEVMSEAGLTHGGFYRHFNSKEQLVTEAFCAGSDGLYHTVEAVVGNKTGKRAVKAIIDNYLTPRHKDNPGAGCAFASMGAELGRADDNTRAAVSEDFLRLVDAIAKHMPEKKPSAARADALFTLSAMVGALTMSRAVNDPKLSASILAAAKDRLTPRAE
jgi:TetR/AcrR family transcriptional repressor of nem operon